MAEKTAQAEARSTACRACDTRTSFDMSAILQATVQAAVREAIYGIGNHQSQQAAAMPVTSAAGTSHLVPLFEPTSSDLPTVDA
ncbi:hypothetical protein HPB50_002821 [Hyalomma asiaticum]|uniref:Uncharacterized protein n=1 Tax=Hyalomma asiaticum TaxID=266040 RepID=A0ACB7SAU0_HYAAI|nr:hypothetical protein HPB50_002821 [Hyalomma asiaticum]